MVIDLEINYEPGTSIWLVATDEVESRDVRSVEDMRGVLADRGESLSVGQCHGLGLLTPVIALFEYAGRYRPDQLGKVLDAIYFPAGSRGPGQAFSRGIGEATFLLRRAEDLEQAIEMLVEEARSDFGKLRQ